MRKFVHKNLLSATLKPLGIHKGKDQYKAIVVYEPDNIELYQVIIDEDLIPILFHHFVELEIDSPFTWGHDIGGG